MQYEPRLAQVDRALEELAERGSVRIAPLRRYRTTVVLSIMTALMLLVASIPLLLISLRQPNASISALLTWLLLSIGLLSWMLYSTVNSMRSPRTLHLNTEGFWYTTGDKTQLSLIRWNEVEEFRCTELTRLPDGSLRSPRAQRRYELSVVVGCPDTLSQISSDPVVLKQPAWRPAKDIALFNVGLPRAVATICEILRRSAARYALPDPHSGFTDPAPELTPDP